ncbi:hypothetical protein [Bacillus massiliigorillae]|uniref:hypothetical protein n=1 Tax=Bacillus massiliigorillae TaxID=1243664 RepID=UPI00039D1782|nr:hypothetical protein [Bacillus massiliigorillae]
MAITLTSKFSPLIDEKFKLGALSTPGVNNDYEFVGAQTVKVTSVNTVALTDYARSGGSRFGTPTELENTIQELTLSQDKAFSFTIDKMNEEETEMKAAEALARQLREVVIPHVDTYRFAQMVAKADKKHVKEVELTKDNVHEEILTGTEALDDEEVPDNRIIFATPAGIKWLKLCDTFVKTSDMSKDAILLKGQVAELDGMPVIKVPTTRLGANVNFIITHRSATVAPIKLEDYRLHVDPPGISGTLAEGRIYFDAFILNNKKKAIYVCKAPAGA